MKPFQWSKLAASKLPGSIFEKFPETFKLYDLDYSDLEKTFAQKEAPKKEGVEKKSEPKSVHFLEHKMSQNMGKICSD